ncbi:unnamed protein product (macronuclear) [Paramecium tetraurelia]|uniref:CDT1 Geminin-binding domain-containing protein n=1 Tax=Paramecium tetraurelia TaxID=5888 RepID=A0BFP4_PARTE|nr:uncharacterized protein GSPATT00028396001 [Paramecium tetraurelia]CAK57361.1 unnamed protein product [Paramecium tetraurelia]|eukprot:XP_001424759.1 hypothetical protein (macronuclear) [Paramecium tetraurelia strain d4-2]
MYKQLNQQVEIKIRFDSLPSIQAISRQSLNRIKKIFNHSELPQIPFRSIFESTGQQKKLTIDNFGQVAEQKQIISTTRKSLKLSKYQSPSYFSRKMQFRKQFLNQFKFGSNTTLFQIINKISQKMNQLHEYRSEKAILSAADKLIKSHIRIQEIELIFKNCKLKVWQSVDTIFVRIYCPKMQKKQKNYEYFLQDCINRELPFHKFLILLQNNQINLKKQKQTRLILLTSSL